MHDEHDRLFPLRGGLRRPFVQMHELISSNIDYSGLTCARNSPCFHSADRTFGDAKTIIAHDRASCRHSSITRRHRDALSRIFNPCENASRVRPPFSSTRSRVNLSQKSKRSLAIYSSVRHRNSLAHEILARARESQFEILSASERGG
jgi:hypothetical protein